MRLIVLHGPAASGKLTVARALSALTGMPVFHNHLVVDTVGAVFEFGSEPFVRLREEFWLAVFAEAAKTGRSLIFTFAPERSVRPRFVADMTGTIEREGGAVHFAQLTVSAAEQERRLDAPSRQAFGKITSRAMLESLRAAGAFDFPPLPDQGLTIDTETVPPAAAAARIAAHFGLA